VRRIILALGLGAVAFAGGDLIDGTRLTYAESSSNPDDQAAVAHSIVERTKNPGFPDNVADVVYEQTRRGGQQFDAVGRELFEAAGDPSNLRGRELDAYLSARKEFHSVFFGTRPLPAVLKGPPIFFEAFPIRPGGWWATLNFVGTIGKHRFYNAHP
jgi:spore germination cell wall hydrolase CwlJ-like protein